MTETRRLTPARFGARPLYAVPVNLRNIDSFWDRRGFSYGYEVGRSGPRTIADSDKPIRRTYRAGWLFVPFWLPAVLTALMPLCLFIRSLRRRWRLAHSKCWNCAYDLTANATGVCPECGTPAAAGTTLRSRVP